MPQITRAPACTKFVVPGFSTSLRHAIGTTCIAIMLLLSSPRAMGAEPSLQAKYEYYKEADGRITVKAQYLAAEFDLGDATHFAVEGVTDAITGATPTGEPAPAGSSQVPLSTLVETRTGIVADVTQTLANGRLRGGYARSTENDYISNGYTAAYVREFNQKNTEVQLGFSYTDDSIIVPWWDADRKKLSRDLLLGITQLIDANTTLTVNLTYGTSTGYMSDPYKIVQKTVELAPGIDLPLTFPENRPTRRSKDILFIETMHYFENTRGSIDASVRFFRDDFGIHSTTLEAAWYQRFGTKWIVRPFVRLYRQNAAKFYHVDLDATTIDPVDAPDITTPYYSSDYRLSAFDGTTVGLKAVYQISERLSVDLMYERYEMTGRDGEVTPDSAYISADTFTVGLKLWF